MATGYVDLISLNSLGALTFLTNNGAGVFGTNMTLNALGGSGTVNGLAVADVNNTTAGWIWPWQNSGSGTLTVLTNGIGTNYTLFLQGSAGSTATLVQRLSRACCFQPERHGPRPASLSTTALLAAPRRASDRPCFPMSWSRSRMPWALPPGVLWLDAYQGPLATSPTNYKRDQKWHADHRRFRPGDQRYRAEF